MMDLDEAMHVMTERFGHDCLIALATVDDGRPSVRTVDGYFEDGAFYVVTHALSEKVRQIEANPSVGVSGEWFSGHGIATNLGPLDGAGATEVRGRVRAAFAGWLREGGHVDPRDPHNCLVRVRLTDGVLTVDDVRHRLDFAARAA